MVKQNEYTARQKMLDNGYEDVIIFAGMSYDPALIGVSDDDRAVYSYDKMLEWLIDHEGMDRADAMEWIDYNTFPSLSYAGPQALIIIYDLIDFSCTENSIK